MVDIKVKTSVFMYVAGPLCGGIIAGLAHHAHLICFEKLTLAGKREVEKSASSALIASDHDDGF